MAVNNGSCIAGSPPSCFKTSQFQQSLIRHTQTVRSRNLTYTIGSDGDVSSQPKNNITYEVYRHNGNVKVATVSFEAEVMRMPEFQEEHSLCLPKNPTDTKCLTKCRHLNNDKYLYIHGDWTIVVSLPIHENEDPEDRWSCQNFTKTGLFRTVAARFAFNYLRKNGRATFNGKTFGMLVIDSCGDKLKTAGKVYDIIRGSKEICDRDGNCLDHNSVVAMIADYSSSVTRQIQTILRRVPLIQMAYGASSVALSNRNEYPYFLRTNPPDDLQAHFMVELMKKINKKASSTVTAVNLLYTDGLYGRTAAEKVREYLKKAGICVHMDRKVNESGTNDFNQLRDDMLADTSDVRLTIVFMDSHHLSDLMDAIKQKEYRIFWLSKGYSFVFSDTWNDDKELLNKYGDIVKGSFSFKFNADFQSLTFGDYLTNRKLPTVEHENPWMSTLEQLVGDCKLPGNFLGTAKTLCTVPRKIIQYRNESYSLHLMKAITATVHGLRQIVNADVHNPNVLFDRKKIGDRYESLLRMKISRYLEEGRSEHQPFTVKTPDSDTYGNGRVGFSIYNIDNNQEYAKVLQTSFKLLDTLGEFERIPEYFRDGRVTDFIISKSDREHCVKSGNTGETDKPVELDGVTIGLGVTGAVVVLLIIVVVVLGLKFLKTRRTNRGDTGDTDYASYNDYLSVEQQKAIRKVAHPPGIYPPSTADQYFTPNNKPILGEDNRGYAPSICEPTTASTTHKPYDGASTSGASQSTNTGESNNGVRLTGDLPKPAPRSMNNDDGCGTTRSQQSSKSAKQQIFVDEITNV